MKHVESTRADKRNLIEITSIAVMPSNSSVYLKVNSINLLSLRKTRKSRHSPEEHCHQGKDSSENPLVPRKLSEPEHFLAVLPNVQVFYLLVRHRFQSQNLSLFFGLRLDVLLLGLISFSYETPNGSCSKHFLKLVITRL